jgi:hypothetical protein
METRPLEIIIWSLAGYVLAQLAAEWATRKVWPRDFPSQVGG